MKLLILHDSIKDDLILNNSFNNDCIIRYQSDYPSLENLLSSVNEINSITNLAFIYHYPGYCELPFYDDLPGTQKTYEYFSNNVINLINNLKLKGLETVDLLSCNLNYDIFIQEMTQIQTDLNINIRYSLDQTGNNPNGNWILESDNIDVKNLYFNDNIDNWNGILNNNIGNAVRSGAYSSIIKYNVATKVFKVVKDFSWNAATVGLDTNFIQLNINETFDGNGFKITAPNGCPGMFAINTTDATTSNRPVIKNIGIIGGSTTGTGSFLLRRYSNFFIIDTCYATGTISGGLAGSMAGADAYSSGIIRNCFATGSISDDCGGMAGAYCSCVIQNCYTTGTVGLYGGGMVGPYCGACIIQNCYNSSTNQTSRGIIGNVSGWAGLPIMANCYSNGTGVGNTSGQDYYQLPSQSGTKNGNYQLSTSTYGTVPTNLNASSTYSTTTNSGNGYVADTFGTTGYPLLYTFTQSPWNASSYVQNTSIPYRLMLMSEPLIYFRPLLTSNIVELYWYPPSINNGYNIDSYIMECSNLSYINVLSSDTRKSIIRNLVTGSSYEFILVASNIFGNSNIASYNLVIPGFKPNVATNFNYTNEISDYSRINFSFNNPQYTGNSTITYNLIKMDPVNINGNVILKSSFSHDHGCELSNIIDPLYDYEYNKNYNYKAYIKSINTVNDSDRNYLSTIINPNLPTNGLKLWLDPYDLTTLTLSNNKVTKWEDKSINKANSYPTTIRNLLPSDISSLQIWLDAADSNTLFTDTSFTTNVSSNGQTIAGWKDKSSNNYQFIQSNNTYKPTYTTSGLNNQSVVTFNAKYLISNSTFGLYSSANSGGSFFCVFLATATNNQQFLMTYQNQTSGVYCNTETEIGYTTGSQTTIGNFGFHRGCYNASISPASTIQNNTPVLMSGILNNNTTIPNNVSIYKNGTSLSITKDNSGFYAGNAYPNTNNNRNTLIGGRSLVGDTFNSYHTGYIGELLWFNSTISDTDRQKIEGYLAWKWGLQSNLPTNHIYKNAAPTVDINNELFAPTYDSSNALINFNGLQYLNLPANTLPSANSSYSIFTYVSTSNISRSNQWFLYSGTPTDNQSFGSYINANTIVHSWWNNNNHSKSNIINDISYLLEMTYDSGIRRTFLNGTLVGYDIVSNKNSDTANNIIGTNSNFTGNLVGSIGDIIIYNRILNDYERLSVNNYLTRRKYNLSLQNIGNIITWLDATDPNNFYDVNNELKVSYNDYVYNWIDRSYSNNNASQSNISNLPIRRAFIQNNLDTLEFNQSYLTLPTAKYPLDAFIVLKLANITDQNGVLGIGPSGNNYSSLSYVSGNKWSIDATSNSVIASTTETSSNFLLMEWSIANNNNYIRRFGSNIANVTTGTWTLPNNSNIFIGNANGFDFSKKFKGHIGEIIMFNKQLDDNTRYPIEGYLAWKWGLQTQLPSIHPFRYFSPYLFYINLITFVPSSLGQLVLWLDASNSSSITRNGNTITRWADLSGTLTTSVNNLSWSDNQLNGLPTINLYGGYVSGTFPVALSNTIQTTFIIINLTTVIGNGSGALYYNQPGNVDTHRVLDFGTYLGVSNFRTLTYAGSWKIIDLSSAFYNSYFMVTSYLSSSILAGAINGNTPTQLSATPTYNATSFSTGSGWNGRVAEIITYSRILTTDERQKVEGYLAWKWGLQSNLPSNHPYKNAAP